jgi:hypothetical protein
VTAPQINVQFRKAGLKARITRGSGYYYWRDDLGRLAHGAESVYVYRASDLTLEHWLALARDVDHLIRFGQLPEAPVDRPTKRWIMVEDGE